VPPGRAVHHAGPRARIARVRPRASTANRPRARATG
jgi:hypothetical protein